MAANVSVIGRTTRVHGRVTGAVDLQVQGFVEGDIAVSGDVTVDAHGIVAAGVRGRRLVVRGAVKGDLIGEEAVVLEEGARVVGDVRAPRVAIGPGALVRGFVETGEANGAPARAGRAPQAAARPQSVARPPSVAAATKGIRPATAKAAAAPPPVVASAKSAAKEAGTASESNGPAARHVGRRPPPPVVPALKKAKGQIAKRKER
jgi:cytoskeletal protein CcmA (bactofilin family)